MDRLRLPLSWLLPDTGPALRRLEVWAMRPTGWGPDSLERFVRYLNGPRGELRRLANRLRSAGWTDTEVEPLDLVVTEIGQTQELLLLVARNLRRRPLEAHR
jgi:hypothetical protein